MWIIRVLVLLLSPLAIQLIRGGPIDHSVCNPLHQTAVPPPPPALPKSFSTNLEWKWLNEKQTISVREIHDGINNMGTQTITMLGQTTQIIYDYNERQYIVYNKDTGCKVTSLGTLAFYDNKFWLTALKMMFNLAAVEGHAPYMGKTVVRNLEVGHWRSCLWVFGDNITVEINMYFSVLGWGMALSIPTEMVPVRFEIKGSHNYNVPGENVTYFHVIGDFTDFNPYPSSDLTSLQPPPGTFCQGRMSRKPMNALPSSFSLVMEVIDPNYFKIAYESVWFHSTKKLIRRDYKEPQGFDPDPTIEIFDFNIGIHYRIDSYTGTCDRPYTISLGDLYAKDQGSNTVAMQTALDFFHVHNANIQYVGTRTVRSVACDVWVGVYLNVVTGRNDTVEWYFTKDNWVEAVDLAIQPAALIRMDIWQGGVSSKPTVRNIYHLNPVPPALDMFSVTPCYNSTQKRRILIPFKVTNGGRIDKVSASYLKGLLHDVLTTKLFVRPLRITDIMLEFQGTSTVYMAATLLDRPPLTNSHMYPQPPSSSQLHPLDAIYFFLEGVIAGQTFIINVTSTIGEAVTIQATGLFNIDYPSDSTKTTFTTTVSTAEAATPPQIQAPTNQPFG